MPENPVPTKINKLTHLTKSNSCSIQELFYIHILLIVFILDSVKTKVSITKLYLAVFFKLKTMLVIKHYILLFFLSLDFLYLKLGI